MTDVQAGADAVVEILEALHQGGELDAIKAILRTLVPRAHPVEVALAALLIAGRGPLIRRHREYVWACDRFEAHLRAIEHVETTEIMAALRRSG